MGDHNHLLSFFCPILDSIEDKLMKVNLEDAACIVLAVFTTILSVSWQVAMVPLLINWCNTPEWLVSTVGACSVSALGFAILTQIPDNWYHRIIYECSDLERPSQSKGNLALKPASKGD